jgi:hypothetical protein
MDTAYLLRKLREHDLHYSEQERAAEVVQGLITPIQTLGPVRGCVCPVGAEKTCRGFGCPRREIRIT